MALGAPIQTTSGIGVLRAEVLRFVIHWSSHFEGAWRTDLVEASFSIQEDKLSRGSCLLTVASAILIIRRPSTLVLLVVPGWSVIVLISI